MSDQQKLGHEFSPYLHEIIRQRYGIEDIEKLIQWVQELPTERRYLTRVATVQDLALQDFDRPTIGIEVNALNPQELQTICQNFSLERAS